MSDPTAVLLSISFGIAVASLVAALFIPDRFHSDPSQMIHGVHQAFIVLGGLTVLSTIVFHELKNNDGDSVSQHNVMQTGHWSLALDHFQFGGNAVVQ